MNGERNLPAHASIRLSHLPLAVLTTLALTPVWAAAQSASGATDDSAQQHKTASESTSPEVLPAITITARKTKESILAVPGSVSVVNADDLAEAPLDPQIAITQKAPNVIWNAFGSSQGFYAIRGISSLGAPVNNWDA
jgi:iron complex outermembrane receptor protein